MSKKQATPLTDETQKRSWMVTLFEADYPQAEVEIALKNYTWVGQLEKAPTTGALHWQICIENKNPISFATLRSKFPKGHFEPRWGTKRQAYDYCTKSESRVSEPIGNGEIRVLDEQGKRSDIETLRSAILDDGLTLDDALLTLDGAAGRHHSYAERLVTARDRKKYSRELRHVTVEYWWGLTGTGKSAELWDLYGGDAYTISDYAHPFDGYAGQDVIVFDEFHSQLPLPAMLKYLDIYPVQLPARYANKYAAFTKIYLVSNICLDEQYRQEQRESRETFAALERRIDKIRYFDGCDLTWVADSQNFESRDLDLAS